MGVWPDHSHLPAAPVKEAERQTCPPAPWTNSLWGLLLSTAPGNTGQTWDHNAQKALFYIWSLQLHVLVNSLSLYPVSYIIIFPSSRCCCGFFCLVSSIAYFLSQTRDVLHFSEDEDAVIVGSLDFCSEYIDDCPWVSVRQHTPQGVRGQPDGSTNDKDMVCKSRDKCMILLSSTSAQINFGLKNLSFAW